MLMDMANVVRSETGGIPIPPVQQNYSDKGSYLSKPYADYNPCQKLQIEKQRLQFLKACKTNKRPPPSLRIRGCNALDDIVKLPKFSEMESVLLENAIRKKKLLIIDIHKLLPCRQDRVYLSSKEYWKIKKHFQKKLAFYKKQDISKWSNWPQKCVTEANLTQKDSKLMNYKKRGNRKRRKTERDANKALNNNSVIIMINEDVPRGAIALLGKGLNFIPTPMVCPRQEQLDMRLVQNQILRTSNKSDVCTVHPSCVPSSLFRTYYGNQSPADDNAVNTITGNMVNNHNVKLQKQQKDKKYKKNITKDEENGLRWLVKKTSAGEIAVVKADKGGAILIVYPSLLRQKVVEKLENEELYKKFTKDPSDKLHTKLFNLWLDGKFNGYVSSQEARAVMGVTDNNNKSTSPHFKPGISYFYPMLKIHKLRKEEVTAGANPPARLVTALQEGISKRSDVFLAKTLIQDLERDFCNDLLKDTNGALLWLDDIDRKSSLQSKKTYKSFTYDFKSLYDSLQPNLVTEALDTAMLECRTDWSDDFRLWILKLVKVSLKCAVGKFEDCWYRQKKGIPTGGSLCVELANITVYYIMRKQVYSNSNLMKHVVYVKRYIDDGAGFFTGSQRQFASWLSSVNLALKPYGLLIDESNIEEVGVCVPFLDILFCIDLDGKLFTDLHIKPTDSRSYLHFGSSHPNHVYSGIVHSQCSRLRRIIISNDVLKIRITELCKSFVSCGYPKSMVERISCKVLSVCRDLNVLINKKHSSINDTPSTQTHKVRIVSTFGTDQSLVDCVKEAIPHLKETKSFKNKDVSFTFVKKTAPSVGSKLSVLKKMSLGIGVGGTSRCGSTASCQCCSVISHVPVHNISVNAHKVVLPNGNCKSKNIIYLAQCKLCIDKCYVGRTVQTLNKRLNGHRHCFSTVVKEGLNYVNASDDDDSFSLGIHLFNEHGITSGFDDYFRFHVLEHVSPSQMEKSEHLWIHKLNTLFPYGINRSNPFGLPVLNCTPIT